MNALPQVKVIPEFIAFNGGLDVITPPLSVESGYARAAQNYEQLINGGYARILGYERFSGQPKPSDAAYSILSCTITGTVNLNDVLTDNAGTSFGTVIALPAGQAVLTLMTGHFSAGNIKVLGVVVGTAAAQEVIYGGSTSLLDAQYRNLAATVYRNLIATVPGQGNIRGVWLYNDVTYAFRDAVGGGSLNMYKSTTAGWSLVALGEEISFSNANTATIDGATLTQGGVTATIGRVVVQTGTLASGVNTGRLIITARAGGNFAAGAATSTGGGAMTLSGVQLAISFAVAGGRFEFVNNNFGGAANTKRMYGCDGKNRGFEFDGTTLVPITTGMTTDRPEHIVAHKYQLFFSFIGSVQHSAPGQPYVWAPIMGAAELAMGDQVTAFKQQPSGQNEGALAIFTSHNISILYGSGVADWKLNPFNQDAGAFAYSVQRIGTTVMVDNRGVSSLSAVQAYGNFTSATLSKRIQTWLKTRRSLVTASCVNRDKTQYRVFFSDGSALFLTFDNGTAATGAYAGMYSMGQGQVVGMLPIVFPVPVRCICSEEMNDGTEVTFFGSTDGYIYQMEKGTSFDGANIEAYLYLVFNHSKSPRSLKHYRRATVEIAGDGYAEFNASFELGYGTTNIDQPGAQNVVAALAPAYWDTFTWDSFVWDGVALLPADVDLTGDAENFSFKIYSNSNYFSSTRLSGVIVQYTPRRILR